MSIALALVIVTVVAALAYRLGHNRGWVVGVMHAAEAIDEALSEAPIDPRTMAAQRQVAPWQ
jgi:hypothetical protein